jgi:hypothetical protein
VFAGAAREAVFSNPDVVRRVNADFVPVALKAGLVNNPPDSVEGRLYREIGRSKAAPQGICVVNSAGKVLDWALMFDDDRSVLAFLDHAAKRFAQFPDAKKPFAAERFMKFPSLRMPDVDDNLNVPVPADRHAQGDNCPAANLVRPGTVLARVFGRALDRDGKLVADSVRQEQYVEDRFHVPVGMQEALAKAATDAGTDRFRLADDLARLFIEHAYLGQLDVNPLGGPGGKGTLKQCEFWARTEMANARGVVRLRIDGQSEAAGATSAGDSADGRLWQHEVKLTWEGLIDMSGKRVSRLLLVARGSERLKWANKNERLKVRADVTSLPAGHAIDQSCGVRYGIIGEPVAAQETADNAPEEPSVPDEASKHLMNALGGAFVVFRARVQTELKLSDEQKQKLAEKFPEYAQETMKAFERLKELGPSEREKEMQEHRQRSEEKLNAFLTNVLQAGQQRRLFQVQLQQAGAFALLGRNQAFDKLEITDEQRTGFMGVVKDMEQKMRPLFQEVQEGGKPEEIMPKVMKVRREHEKKVEALLSDTQKKQWRELLGKPFELGD